MCIIIFFFLLVIHEIGFALGGLFGMFMSSFEMASVDPAIYEQPMKQQLKATAKDMAQRSYSMAKNFAIVGAIFSGTECVIETVSKKKKKKLLFFHLIYY
jgi:import inner membrane translocase subunit TIM22